MAVHRVRNITKPKGNFAYTTIMNLHNYPAAPQSWVSLYLLTSFSPSRVSKGST